MIRREFFTALSSLPFLGFLKPESFTMGFDIGNQVCASTEAKPNTFRKLYKFIKENDARLYYDDKFDCFVIDFWPLANEHNYCSFEGADKDESPTGNQYTQPALEALIRSKKLIGTPITSNKNCSRGITDHEAIQKEIEAVLCDYECELVHDFKNGHYILRGKDGPLGKEFNVARGGKATRKA